jgi:hypothetical protein
LPRTIRVGPNRIAIKSGTWSDFQIRELSQVKFASINHEFASMEFSTTTKRGRKSGYIIGVPTGKVPGVAAYFAAVGEN